MLRSDHTRYATVPLDAFSYILSLSILFFVGVECIWSTHGNFATYAADQTAMLIGLLVLSALPHLHVGAEATSVGLTLDTYTNTAFAGPASTSTIIPHLAFQFDG